MIPKIIHYVWVGGKEKPKDIQRCMKTWKKHLKGYVIKEWNETNFDINSHPFVKKAYEAAKALADDLKKELDEASIKVARIIKEDEEKEFTPDGL